VRAENVVGERGYPLYLSLTSLPSANALSATFEIMLAVIPDSQLLLVDSRDKRFRAE
jgi:hypothetical protein